jgi:hypothetical protein
LNPSEFGKFSLQANQSLNLFVKFITTVTYLVLNIKWDRTDMLGVASIKPRILFANLDEILVALENHHEGKLMCQQVLRYNLITVFTFFALRIRFKLFLGPIFRLDIAVMARNRLIVNDNFLMNIWALLPWNDKRLCVDIPPVSSLVLDKVAYHFVEPRTWQVTFDKFYNVFYVLKGLV